MHLFRSHGELLLSRGPLRAALLTLFALIHRYMHVCTSLYTNILTHIIIIINSRHQPISSDGSKETTSIILGRLSTPFLPRCCYVHIYITFISPVYSWSACVSFFKSCRFSQLTFSLYKY